MENRYTMNRYLKKISVGIFMKSAVKKFIKRHHLLQKNTTVLVGVSGGPDSTALLHLLIAFRDEWNLNIIVLTMDHQLRGKESQTDVQYVQEICERWNVDVVTASRDVKSYQEQHGLSLQMAARQVRYRFFEEQMNRWNACYLALGHHGDDQIETMFMTMTRSASSTALSGIPVKRAFACGEIIRPLLSVSRESIKMYCEQHNISPRFDPSNYAIEDMRVYFRKKVSPIVKEKNSNLHTTIQYLSETLSEDETFLQAEAKRLIDHVVQYKDNQVAVSFQIDEFIQYAHTLQRRAFHLLLNYLYEGVVPKSLSYIHEDDFFALIADQKGTVKIDFPRGILVERSYGTVILHEQVKKTDNAYQEVIQIPGKTVLPDGSKLIAEMVTDPGQTNENKHTYFLMKETITFPLIIRTRQPGDRMSWQGLSGSKKLKDIFIDEKVPRSERDTWPVVVDDLGKVIWLIGIKKGELFHSSKNRTMIRLHYHKANE